MDAFIENFLLGPCFFTLIRQNIISSNVFKDIFSRVKSFSDIFWRNFTYILCFLDIVVDEELQLLYQIFEDLRVRSKGFCGIDRDVFVKFCPIPVSERTNVWLGNNFDVTNWFVFHRASGDTESSTKWRTFRATTTFHLKSSLSL